MTPPKKTSLAKTSLPAARSSPSKPHTHTHTRRRLVQRSADLGQGPPPIRAGQETSLAKNQPTWGEVGTPRNGPRNEPGQKSVDMGARETWAPQVWPNAVGPLSLCGRSWGQGQQGGRAEMRMGIHRIYKRFPGTPGETSRKSGETASRLSAATLHRREGERCRSEMIRKSWSGVGKINSVLQNACTGRWHQTICLREHQTITPPRTPHFNVVHPPVWPRQQTLFFLPTNILPRQAPEQH